MKKGELITLKRVISKHDYTSSGKREIVGFEDVLKRTINNNIIPLYRVSEYDLQSLSPDSEKSIFSENKIIGYIFSFDDNTVTFRSIFNIDFDIDKKIAFAFTTDHDKENDKHIVQSIDYAYIYNRNTREILNLIKIKN